MKKSVLCFVLLVALAAVTNASQYGYNAIIEGTLTVAGTKIKPISAGSGISVDSSSGNTVLAVNYSTLSCPITLGSSSCAINLNGATTANSPLSIAYNQSLSFVDSTSGTLTISAPTTMATQTWKLPSTAPNNNDLLSYATATSSLQWLTYPTLFNPTSCPTFGLTTGCSSIVIGQATGTAADSVAIANTVQSGGANVSIATGTTGVSLVTIGSTSSASSAVTLNAGGNSGISLVSTKVNVASTSTNPTISIGPTTSGATVTIATGTGTNSVSIGSSSAAANTVIVAAGSTGGIKLNADTTLGSGNKLIFTSTNGKTTSLQGSASASANVSYVLPPAAPPVSTTGAFWHLGSDTSGNTDWNIVPSYLIGIFAGSQSTTSSSGQSASIGNGNTGLVFNDLTQCSAAFVWGGNTLVSYSSSGFLVSSSLYGRTFGITFTGTFTTSSSCAITPKLQTSSGTGITVVSGSNTAAQFSGGATAVSIAFTFNLTAASPATVSFYGTANNNCNSNNRVTFTNINFQLYAL